MDFLSTELPQWPWSASLAGVAPDPFRTYRVVEIGATVARDRCAKVGIETGTRLRTLISTGEKLVVELPDAERRIVTLEITYGWYIRVEPEMRVTLPARPPRLSLPTGIP